jgi:hypothetical protein
VRLAFKLFDSEGLTPVNLLSDGSGALEGMRERARDLGMVLDEHLVRDAERARTELDTLSQVISADLARAALGRCSTLQSVSDQVLKDGAAVPALIAGTGLRVLLVMALTAIALA